MEAAGRRTSCPPGAVTGPSIWPFQSARGLRYACAVSLPLLVATDLDGTILRADGTISARTVAAFARAEAAGARVVLVTGRAPRVMGPIADAFGNRGTAICANGTLSYDLRTGETRALHLISPESIAAAARALRAAVPGIGFAAERLTGPVADSVYRAEDPAADAIIARVPDSELFSEPAVKLRARHPDHAPDEILALAVSACEGIVEVSHNGAAFLEAGPPGVTKATALEQLAASYGIGRESVLAFGDMPNDLPMLTWAGTSCAVADAHPSVLAAVTRVTGACGNDGVAAYLEGLYEDAAV